jgi:hypothetical protein
LFHDDDLSTSGEPSALRQAKIPIRRTFQSQNETGTVEPIPFAAQPLAEPMFLN